jgi:tRNA nucleotidyltransferase (CCA-adding enzyme)
MGLHWRRAAREDARVTIPEPIELIARLRALPAGAALLDRLGPETPVHLVGGAVRDLVLERPAPDLDLVIDGDAPALASELDPGAVVHPRFGTATFTVDGFRFDIARARRERYPHPGALPEVEAAGLEEDLRRRDFTVNAVAMALGGERAGTVKSVPSAWEDLGSGQLRVLHDASFVDDPTRLLRLARYAARLGFSVEPCTSKLAAAAIASGALATVSGPRVGNELRLLAGESDPVAAFAQLHQLGIDEAIEPALEIDDPGLAGRALELLPQDGRSELVVLALAARAIDAPKRRGLLDQLGFDSAERDVIVAAAGLGGDLARALADADSPSAIAGAVSGAPPEAVAIAGAMGPAEPARDWLERLRHVRLEIDGSDVVAAGVPEGPRVGRALRAALAARLDGRAMDREAQLAEALQAAAASE